MPYAILTTDRKDAGGLRARTREAHIAYLDAHRAKLLAAGALTADDGTGGHGGILIVDTDDRKEAEAFAAGDPFTKAGLFEKVTVARWRKAYFDGRKLI